MHMDNCNAYDWFSLDISVREENDNDQIQSDEAEAEVSPTKSPTTPKNVKCKNSSGRRHSVLDFPAMLLSLTDMKTRAPASHADKPPAPFRPAKCCIYQWLKMADSLSV